MKRKILIVDDEDEIRTQMKWALARDYDPVFAADRATAVGVVKEFRPAVVLLDLGLPPEPATAAEGLATLTDILALDTRCKVIVITGQSDRTVALEAVGRGAYDFLGKPVDLDLLHVLLQRCYHLAELEADYDKLRLRFESATFEGMLGTSDAMQAVFNTIRKVATTEAPVLILGESGTGKEMVAQAIHHRSSRKDGPFVPINCGAIPENLLESELFGHERGAFTGAHVQRKGRIEHAEGGTLFLDEIGELPPPLQVKLLRFLQEQTIERVGGRQEIRVNTRVVAATNADLKAGMQQGTFREDLFYRLAVVQVSLPPLRERDGDIQLIAKSLLDRFAVENRKSISSFGRDAIRAIQSHAWPGNVREMQNRVRRAIIMCATSQISATDLELENTLSPMSGTSLKDAREMVERDLVRRALKKHSGKITQAAQELGISRPSLYELMERLQIEKSEL